MRLDCTLLLTLGNNQGDKTALSGKAYIVPYQGLVLGSRLLHLSVSPLIKRDCFSSWYGMVQFKLTTLDVSNLYNLIKVPYGSGQGRRMIPI